MVAAVAALLALASWLLLRRLLRGTPRGAGAAAWSHPRGNGPWALALAVTLATQIPLIRTVSSLLLADACGHAAIAAQLARQGAPHGWIDLFNGGFPLGPHYPSVGWILAALLIRCGVPAPLALSGLAALATVLVPMVALLGGRSLGARPVAALAAALALGCASPMSAFVGGWGAYLEQGLFSQALVMPLVVGFLVALASGRSTVLPPVLAALCLATHPQVAVAAFAVGGVTALYARDPRVLVALGRSAIAAGAVTAAVFVPGIPTLTVPFGWPPMTEWKRIGFPAAEVLQKLGDGDLLDAYGAPSITVAWAFALVIAVLLRRARPCRAVLVGTIVAVLCAMSGQALDALGALGAAVLSVFQPLRAMAVLPCAAAASILVAVEELGAALSPLAEGGVRGALARRAVAAAPWAALGLAMAPAVRARADYGAEVRATYRAWNETDWCGPGKPAGYATATVFGWLRSLPRGRFTIAKDKPLENCPATHGVELASPVPMGRPIGAGAHVGVNHIAFRQLRPTEPGSDRRAESLGIRTVLHTRDQRPTPAEAWRIVAEAGDMMLSERIGGGDFVGVGCVEREVSGSNAVLHEALIRDLE